MDFEQSLDELRSQREKLDTAILALEMLTGDTPRRGRPPASLAALTGGKRRGRPPGSKNVTSIDAKSKAKAKGVPGRRSFTPAQKKAQAEKMRKYWAAKKRAAKKTAKKAIAKPTTLKKVKKSDTAPAA